MHDTNGVFVAGTDTGVGKTAVSGGLAGAVMRRGIDVVAVKPVQTGCIREDEELIAPDARFVSNIIGSENVACPFLFEPPLAPRVAAEVENQDLSYNEVLEETKKEANGNGFAVVEGIGGMRVPLADDKEVIDLAADLDFPALVVSRPDLGTLNHTALTIESLERRGIDVIGVVLNRYPENPDTAEKTNPSEIERMTRAEVLGKIPELDLSTPEGNFGDITDNVERNLNIKSIIGNIQD